MVRTFGLAFCLLHHPTMTKDTILDLFSLRAKIHMLKFPSRGVWLAEHCLGCLFSDNTYPLSITEKSFQVACAKI